MFIRFWVVSLMVALLAGYLTLFRPTWRSSFSLLRNSSGWNTPLWNPRIASSKFSTSASLLRSESPAMAEPTVAKSIPATDDQIKHDVSVSDSLPKLSAADFQVYNRLAVMMEYYHDHFRRTWNMLYKACSSGQRPAGVSIRSFINTGLQLCQHITIHHGIEEQSVFPELAERMPMFEENNFLKKQHEEIHDGLTKTLNYLLACQDGEREFRMGELKDIMDSYGKVLWEHLDQEVLMLGAENMRKYWSKEEILAMRW